MKKLLIAAAALSALALSATQAGAVILAAGNNSLGGTTSAVEPQLAGTIVQDVDTAVSFAMGGGTYNATVQSRVVLSDDGTYDFYWRVHDTSFDGVTVAPASLGMLRIGQFGESIVGLNGNYRTDGSGDVGPDTAEVFTGFFDGDVNFKFSDGLAAGSDSLFMFLDTSAKHYGKTALFDLANGDTSQVSDAFATFGVAGVPEPATWALMIGGFGLAGVGLRRRRATAVSA
jgi:hypothetical protein